MDGWVAPKIWPDAECWIIGGGISLPRIFGVPEEVIQKVHSGGETFRIYSKYLTPLHSRHVIATNVAYLLGLWVSVLYFVDKQFWLANKLDIVKNFHNLKVTDVGNLPSHRSNEHRNIKKMNRDNAAGITLEPGINKWNHNAGGGGINLAAHFGAKRILLLGFDMKPDNDGKTHWHQGLSHYKYPTKDRTFERFLKYFPYIKRDADKLGIEILNVTENGMSVLPEFTKVKLKEVL